MFFLPFLWVNALDNYCTASSTKSLWLHSILNKAMKTPNCTFNKKLFDNMPKIYKTE